MKQFTTSLIAGRKRYVSYYNTVLTAKVTFISKKISNFVEEFRITQKKLLL